MYIQIVMLVSDSMGLQDIVNSRRQPSKSGACTSCHVVGVRYGNNVVYPSATMYTTESHKSRQFMQHVQGDTELSAHLRDMHSQNAPQITTLADAHRDLDTKEFKRYRGTNVFNVLLPDYDWVGAIVVDMAHTVANTVNDLRNLILNQSKKMRLTRERIELEETIGRAMDR